MGDRTQAFRIASSQVWETRAEALVVGANQRNLSLQVDVIANQDQRAGPVFCIDTAGRISDDQRSKPHALENSNRKSDLRRGVALVKMYSPLHCRHCNFVCISDEHLTSVADRCGAGEIWNARVWSCNRLCELVGKTAKART